MIGKIVKGNYFRGLLDYLAGKKLSKLIGGNMFGTTPESLADEFSASRELNPNLKKIVNHVSLSLPSGETVDEKTWNQIASDYIQDMGFEGSQYAVYRHSDRDHDRVHIVASRVRISDGSTVSDSWDYYKNQTAIRDLEKKYELTPVQCSWVKERSSMTWPELKYLKKTGDRSVRLELQDRIDDLAFDSATMPELFAKMALAKIGLEVWSYDKGNVTGVSYSLDGVSYPGYKLGKAYSFFGLQKYLNITCEFDKNSDFTQITALKINTKSIVENILNESNH